MKKKSMSEFTGLYSIVKTLKFELKPIGKTRENIEKNGLLLADMGKIEDYNVAKQIINNYHKWFIDDVLSNIKLDWAELEKVIKIYRNDKTQKKLLEDTQDRYRKQVRGKFSKDKNFKLLTAATPRYLFEKMIPEMFGNSKEIDTFKKFSTYFAGFQQNRRNIYSSEATAATVPFRVINDNFPKFMQNIEVYNTIKNACPQILNDAEKELSEILDGKKLSEIFSIKGADNILTQKGIGFFNQVINGKSKIEGNKKIKGINEFFDLYLQQHSDFPLQKKNIEMIPLFKQILSDYETRSSVHKMYENDEHLQKNILCFWNDEIIDCKNETVTGNVLKQLEDILEKIKSYDFEKLYINQSDLEHVSKELFGNWEELYSCLTQYGLDKFVELKNKKRKMELDKWLKQSCFSFSLLNEVIKKYHIKSKDFGNKEKRIEEIFVQVAKQLSKKDNPCINYLEDKGLVAEKDELAAFQLLLSIEKKIQKLKSENKKIPKEYEEININDSKKIVSLYTVFEYVKPILEKKDVNITLQESQEDVAKIKLFLDMVFSILYKIKPLIVGDENNKELSFYNEFTPLYDQLKRIIPVYNKVRNYITKKTIAAGKYKLNFECPTLAAGWDLNKEMANATVIFLKDDSYYLGVFNAKKKPKFTKNEVEKEESHYQKMVYKLLPGPNKMLPKVFFSQKRAGIFNPPKDILDGYKAEKHLKNSDNFDIKFCHKLIDYFKWAISQHSDWKFFNFIFSDTNSYNNISDFYKEITEQGYKMNFVNISEEEINKFVDEGRLYLFQIYNKDFAKGAHGNPNLHTLYWKQLFSKENLKDVVFKLNGEAELFYREASIKQPIKHKVGEKIINRRDKNGNSIPEVIHDELFKYVNKKLKNELSTEATEYLDKIIVKDVVHEIIKDRRYTSGKFLFHTPITINLKASGRERINEKTREYLSNNPAVNIIGIDRGEYNLIYLTLINQKGEILEQKSFNIIDNGISGQVDYYLKLNQHEKEQQIAKKSWTSTRKIKELKEGYLSVVIHEIVSMMVKNNAPVIFEDLNFGFKRGQFCIEKPIYQKFEKMLVDKLNYLVFKEQGLKEGGSVLSGYQLTEKFVGFQKISKQNGWLFSVPAGYTSKIDPETGFVNLFNLKELTNLEKKKKFFLKFDEIAYDDSSDSFMFKFDYDNFKVVQESAIKKWVVYTNDKRIKCDLKTKEMRNIFLTEELKKLFTSFEIEWQQGCNLLPAIKKIKTFKVNATFFDIFYRFFVLTLQMRNTNEETGEDYIISPVKNSKGDFFDSRKADNKLPQDADANGAYHIALKGLYLLKNNFPQENKTIKRISHYDWLEFAQKELKQ